MLNRVSRSFAVVIQQLPPKLRDAVAVFYLVLRALDTVEDDMALDDEIKVPLLRAFHEKCTDRRWKMTCGAGAYVDLMESYPLVTEVYATLDADARRVIADITRRMGAGMADFIPQEVKTAEQYDLYCHYVAGLVGVGLSQLFAASGLESEEFARLDALSNEMGLFLQKTNIIRDYLEDIVEEPAPRMFWPREIWGKHARALADLKDPAHAEAAVACLNEMVLNALGHAEASLEYMARLRDPAIFRFCAIPQVMAIATLSACFNNHAVFTGVVKLRRGETAKLMYHLSDFGDAAALFRAYAARLGAVAAAQAAGDPSLPAILAAAGKLERAAAARLGEWGGARGRAAAASARAPISLAGRALALALALAYALYAWQAAEARAWLGLAPRPEAAALDALNRGVAAVLLGYALVVALTGRRLAA
jgi:farnesyl-diphosphate farnesyltransferase